MYIAGYLASVLIGLSLGLIGGGGSILTVPVLVYLFGVDATIATVYSLFVVGSTSVAGSLSYFRKRLVNMKMALLFGIPSIATVFLTRTYIVPAIPARIASIGGFSITKSMLLMALFATLMIFASYSMIKKASNVDESLPQPPASPLLVAAQGLLVGLVTGMIGAGGGFLIIPALVNLLKAPMKTAVGTSLVIISINSLLGFLFSISHIAVQWQLILTITGIAIAGILAGSYLATKIDGKKLKTSFGWFVLAMGIYILAKETILK